MKFAITLFSLVMLMSCGKPTYVSYNTIRDDSGDIAMSVFQENPGKTLMENNCYLCHNPKTAKESISAPPMFLVKASYLKDGNDKERFIEDMVSFIKNPNKNSSRMPEAIEDYGLMPYQFYPENTLRKIAEYMFENEVETPDWFIKI